MCDTEGSHESKVELVVGEYGSVVPGEIFLAVGSEIDLEAIIREAFFASVSSTEADADIFEWLIAVEGGIEIPFAVPFFNYSVVVVYLQVVIGFDLGVEWAVAEDGEPEFDLIRKGRNTFVNTDVGFDIDGTFLTLGVDLDSEKLIMAEVVGEEGVGLFGEIGPRLDLDALGFGHMYLN